VTVGREGASYRAVDGAVGAGGAARELGPEALLAALNRAGARPPVLALLLGCGLAVALAAGVGFGSSWRAALAFGATAVAAVGCAHHGERAGRRVAVAYEMAPEVARAYERVVAAFRRLQQAGGVWHTGSPAAARGAARQGGQRGRPPVRVALPPRMQANLRAPLLRAGRQRLCFLPDRLLVYEAQLVWAVRYADLQVETGTVWVRESAAPDRHGLVGFRGAAGLSEAFECTNPALTAAVAAALAGLARVTGEAPAVPA
jgi:hypothetical protein